MREIIVFLILIFFGCKRETSLYQPDTFINGQVINSITGLPVPNVQLKFVECGNPYMHSPTCNSLGYVITDTNGYFSFSYENNSSKYHYCMLHENGFMHSDTNYSIVNELTLDNLSNQNILLSVIPYSRIWFQIQNINCFNSNDLIEIYYSNEINNFEFPYPWIHYGCANYESLNWEQVPMGNHYFHYKITKNNVIQDIYDTLKLDPGQDTLLQIFY